jgi:hypothetical protein
MTTTTTTTAGAALTAELRRYFTVGPRTRRSRKGRDLHNAMVEAIEIAAEYPGYYHEPLQTALCGAYAVALSYRKHVGGYRISGEKIAKVNAMTAWQFAAFLGQMVDAGVENTGQGEEFLSRWAA